MKKKILIVSAVVALAVIIAIGYSLSIVLLESHFPTVPPDTLSQWWQWIFGATSSLIGTVGFSLIFKISLKKLPIVAIGGIVTYIFYAFTIFFFPTNELFATFIASLFMALFSEICARVVRAPAVVFLFPCAIPIVPGGALYRSMYSLLTNAPNDFQKNISITGQVILGIALGLSVASMIWGVVSFIIHKTTDIKKQKKLK